jgi:hypothetical protein
VITLPFPAVAKGLVAGDRINARSQRVGFAQLRQTRCGSAEHVLHAVHGAMTAAAPTEASIFPWVVVVFMLLIPYLFRTPDGCAEGKGSERGKGDNISVTTPTGRVRRADGLPRQTAGEDRRNGQAIPRSTASDSHQDSHQRSSLLRRLCRRHPSHMAMSGQRPWSQLSWSGHRQNPSLIHRFRFGITEMAQE